MVAPRLSTVSRSVFRAAQNVNAIGRRTMATEAAATGTIRYVPVLE